MEMPVKKFLGPVLATFIYQYTKKCILLESACDALSEKRSTPFNPWVVAMVRSFNYLARRGETAY